MRVGDYVAVEPADSQPFWIGRVEKLVSKKTVKLRWFESHPTEQGLYYESNDCVSNPTSVIMKTGIDMQLLTPQNLEKWPQDEIEGVVPTELWKLPENFQI